MDERSVASRAAVDDLPRKMTVQELREKRGLEANRVSQSTRDDSKMTYSRHHSKHPSKPDDTGVNYMPELEARYDLLETRAFVFQVRAQLWYLVMRPQLSVRFRTRKCSANYHE